MSVPPQFAHPFRVEGGSVATVPQGSLEEIRQCVVACLRTRVGSRLDAPTYGVPNKLFERQPRMPTADAYLRAVEEAEPRAALLGQAEVEGLIQRVVIEQEGASV
jgi:phage baseplate assembly protein W